jgi:hypothetical protein
LGKNRSKKKKLAIKIKTMPKNNEKTKEEKIGSPISELEEILDEAGKDVKDLFGPALTFFAGATAMSESFEVKKDKLENMIAR